MLQDSIFGKLARFFLLLKTVFSGSVICRACSAVDRAFSAAVRESRVLSVFTRESRAENAYRQSAFATWTARVFDAVSAFFQRLYERMQNAVRDSLLYRFYAHFLRQLVYFRYEYLIGGFFLLMFAVPHDMWANPYALLGTLVLAAALFLLVVLKKRRVFHLSDMGLPFLLFALSCVIAIFTSYAIGDSIRVFLFFVTAFLIAMLLVADIETEAQLRRVLGMVFVAVMITAVVAIVQRITGVEVDPALTDVNLNKNMPGRVFSTFGNPNNYAEFLVLLLPLSVAFPISCKRPLLRAAETCLLVLPLVALLMTYSRSCWVSFALAVIVFVFFYDKRWIPVLILAGICAVPFLPQSITNRILTIGSSQDTSNSYRLYIWEAVGNMLRDYGVRGIGLGPASFAKIYPAYSLPGAITAPHSHMLYLEVWLETGLIGILSLLWYLVSLVKQGLGAAKRSMSKFQKAVLVGGASALIGISFACAAEYIWFYPRVMFAYFLVCGVITASVRITKKVGEN